MAFLKCSGSDSSMSAGVCADSSADVLCSRGMSPEADPTWDEPPLLFCLVLVWYVCSSLPCTGPIGNTFLQLFGLFCSFLQHCLCPSDWGHGPCGLSHYLQKQGLLFGAHSLPGTLTHHVISRPVHFQSISQSRVGSKGQVLTIQHLIIGGAWEDLVCTQFISTTFTIRLFYPSKFSFILCSDTGLPVPYLQTAPVPFEVECSEWQSIGLSHRSGFNPKWSMTNQT